MPGAGGARVVSNGGGNGAETPHIVVGFSKEVPHVPSAPSISSIVGVCRVLFLMTLGLAPSAARASCIWSPNLTMVPASGVESHGFDFTWAAVPTGGDCSLFSLDHYVIAIKESSYPATASSGMPLNAGSSLTARLLPHRAQRTFYAKLFACDNSTCSDIFGSAANETFVRTSDHDELEIDTTEQEIWEIVGLNDEDGGITGLEGETNDPGSFFFPPGWTNAGQLAIYGYDQESTEQNLKVIVANTAGWQNFNTATFSTAVEVAGDHSSDVHAAWALDVELCHHADA